MIYNKEDLWKTCYWWGKNKCKEHLQKKNYYCKADNKFYCFMCFCKNHLKCNKEEIPNELEEIEKYLDGNYISNLYNELINKFPEDPILKMIDENKGIRSIYIIRQLNYFIENNIN